jgi:hypothetical protein
VTEPKLPFIPANRRFPPLGRLSPDRFEEILVKKKKKKKSELVVVSTPTCPTKHCETRRTENEEEKEQPNDYLVTHGSSCRSWRVFSVSVS